VNKGLPLALSAGLFLAYACGADPLFVNESDAVITIQAEGVNYSKYSTYYMPQKIVDLCLQPRNGDPSSDSIGGAAGGPAIDPVNCFATVHHSDADILDSMEGHMADFGYERVESASEADLVILLGFVSRTSWSLSRPYCYPNSYYSGCVSQENNPQLSVPYGAMIVQMIDVDASEGASLESVWTAGIHQLHRTDDALGTDLGGGASARSEIWADAISTAFEQSPYLNDGGRN
jgi:hypothetical protein